MSHSTTVRVSPADASHDASHPWAPTPFACTSKPDGWGSVCLCLAGELDLATCPRFDRILMRFQNDKSVVSLDLQELSFLDGAGLTAIVRAGARASELGTKLILVGARGQVSRLLDLTGPFPAIEMITLEHQGNRS